MSEPANSNGGRVSLSSVIGGLTAALVRAQHLSDLEVARLRESREGSVPGTFGVRSFEIADITVELKCAIEEPTADDSDLSIAVGSSALRGVEERHLSTLKLRFAASPIRVVSVSETVEPRSPASGRVPDET